MNRIIVKRILILVAVLAVLLQILSVSAEEIFMQEGYEKQSRGYRTLVHWIEGNGHRLYGEYSIPDGLDMEKPHPILILCHGFGATAKGINWYTYQLVQSGFLCYSFDFSGGAKDSRSEGSMLDMSIMTEKAELEDVLEDIASQPFVDTERIALIGFSQGSAVAGLVAAEAPERVKCEVLVYPAFSISDEMHALYGTIEQIPDDPEYLDTPVGKNYMTDIWDLNLTALSVKFEGPVLLIHGTDDTTVPYEYSVEAQEQFKNAELITVDGGGHGFGVNEINELIPSIVSFLQNSGIIDAE